MKNLSGIMVSPGIAIGKAFVCKEEKLVIPKYNIDAKQVNPEFERFSLAVRVATREIENLKQRIDRDKASSQLDAGVLQSHLMMLSDPDFKDKVYKILKLDKKNAEWVIIDVIDDYLEKLQGSEDQYLRDRGHDLHDVSRRLMNILLAKNRISLIDLDEDVIVIAHNLMPSDAISMNKNHVLGLALDVGGKTSHTAILARAFGIPAVVGLSNISRFVNPGDPVIVDGHSGKVIINPSAEVVEEYQHLQGEWKLHYHILESQKKLLAETQDGRVINLKANIEVPEEVDLVIKSGADGIGLYRSEYLFMTPGNLPTEEEQFREYSKVLKAIPNKTVVIRTLDLGGDKLIHGFSDSMDENPILGWRAVRFCLSHQLIFKTQLRALLRASIYGRLKIMFPFVSGKEELEDIIKILESVKTELTAENIPFTKNVPVGIMIEIPSAALTSDILAKQVDFFSIGTNDLIQYTIAVDRVNEKVAYLYTPFHPAVLRLLKITVENGHNQNIPVGMCGEMAGDSMSIVALVGLGLDTLSMSASMIPEIKKIIRSITYQEAKDLVAIIMAMDSHKTIDEYIKTWMEEKFGYSSG